MSMLENRTSGYLYSELFSKSNEEKWTTFQSMACSLLLIKMLLKTSQLLSKHFPSGLSLCTFYFLFYKGKDTLLQFLSQAFNVLYIFFAIFFRFHKFFNNFHLSKNILVNKVFHWNVFFYIFTPMTQGSCQFLFEVK